MPGRPAPTRPLNSETTTATRRAKPAPPPRPVVEPGWVSSHCATPAKCQHIPDERPSGKPRASKHKNCYSLKCDCWCHKHRDEELTVFDDWYP